MVLKQGAHGFNPHAVQVDDQFFSGKIQRGPPGGGGAYVDTIESNHPRTDRSQHRPFIKNKPGVIMNRNK